MRVISKLLVNNLTKTIQIPHVNVMYSALCLYLCNLTSQEFDIDVYQNGYLDKILRSFLDLHIWWLTQCIGNMMQRLLDPRKSSWCQVHATYLDPFKYIDVKCILWQVKCMSDSLKIICHMFFNLSLALILLLYILMLSQEHKHCSHLTIWLKFCFRTGWCLLR